MHQLGINNQIHITVLSLGLSAIAVMLYHGQSFAPHAPRSSMLLSSVTGSSSLSTVDDIIAPVIVAVYKQNSVILSKYFLYLHVHTGK